MDKYKYVKDELWKYDVYENDKVYIEDEELIKEYDELVKQNKDLPEGITKEVWMGPYEETNTKYNYLKVVPLTDEQIEAQLEMEQLRRISTISFMVKFLFGFVVVILLFVFIGLLFA
ncbi:MAG: hypothetical protein ACVCEJ_07235 [Candidatus Izemoplasmataceae bacterium]